MNREEFDALLEEYGYGVHIDYKQTKRRRILEEFDRMYDHTTSVANLAVRLQVRCDELTVAKRILLRVLDEVEWVLHPSGKLYCPWCRGIRPNHMTDCPRQAALLAVEMEVQNYGPDKS